MIADGARVGEKPIKRHHGRDPGEEGENREEGDAAGCGHDPVDRDRPKHPQEDVAPAPSRDLLRGIGFAPAIRFPGARTIDSETRITPFADLIAPVIAFFGFVHGGRSFASR